MISEIDLAAQDIPRLNGHIVIRGETGCLWWKDDTKSSIRDPTSIGGLRLRNRMYDFRPRTRFSRDSKPLSP